MIITPKLTYQLDPQGNGAYFASRGDGTVMHVDKDGAITSDPDGTAANRNNTCTLDGPFLVFQPVEGGTLFYFGPGE